MRAGYIVLTVMTLVACTPSADEVTRDEIVVPPVITADGITPADRRAWLDTSRLNYTSDYLSFVGKDARGFVALALDTNRGRDGADYQAQHYTAMHDQERGWVEVVGNGEYANPGRELGGLPDSPAFKFKGDPQHGLAVTSPVNGFDLMIKPVVGHLVRHDARTFFALGTAPATMHWDGRTIEGRVIHEDLVKTAFNMITRPDVSQLNNFNGFYLLTADGGDLYLHSTGGREESVPEPVLGFHTQGGRNEVMQDLRVEETGHGLAWGFYRWPTTWIVSWRDSEGPASLRMDLRTRKGMVNWVLGGYSLGIVEGELNRAGKTTSVYGWAEMIR